MAAETDLQGSLDRLTERKVPGLSVVVIRDGEPVWEGTSGLADIVAGRPPTLDSAYLWFSMTKIVTATAAMQLIEEGAMDLEDPVARFLPEFLSRARAGQWSGSAIF